MPIKINLLAEAQELEDLKRRDPVKRLAFIGVVLVILMLGWSSLLVGKSMLAKSELSRQENEIQAQSNSYKQVLENLNSLVEHKRRLLALDRLATNRFLVGTLLNALQKNTLDNVQLVRLKLEQTSVLVPEVKPAKGVRLVPKPATIKENTTLLLSGTDKSPTPGDLVTKFQKQLSNDPFFKGLLDANGFRLTTLGAAQLDADGKPKVLFTIEARLPEKVR